MDLFRYICSISLHYLSDGTGQIIAVQVPIEYWETLRHKYPEIETLLSNLPQWRKELIDLRLSMIEENPARILPADSLFEELDRVQK